MGNGFGKDLDKIGKGPKLFDQVSRTIYLGEPHDLFTSTGKTYETANRTVFEFYIPEEYELKVIDDHTLLICGTLNMVYHYLYDYGTPSVSIKYVTDDEVDDLYIERYKHLKFLANELPEYQTKADEFYSQLTDQQKNKLSMYTSIDRKM
jgi:hypothetical protein